MSEGRLMMIIRDKEKGLQFIKTARGRIRQVWVKKVLKFDLIVDTGGPSDVFRIRNMWVGSKSQKLR